MAQTVLLKRSSVAGNVPGSSDLSLGEIAVNTADGAVYIKKGNNDIVAVADNDILHIDTTNSRVGIGTTSPSNQLHIQSSGTSSAIRLEREDTSDEMLVLLGSSYGYIQNTTGPLGLGGTNSNTDIYINASGNVGIGTTSPSSRLNVVSSSNATNGIIVQNATTGTAARSNLRLLSDAAQFDIYATSSTYNGVSSWTDAGVLSTSSNASGGLVLNAQVGGIKFQDATTEIMRIADGGNVGIGTDNPGVNLQINDSTTTQTNSEFRIYGYDTATSDAKYGRIFIDTGGNLNVSAQDSYLLLSSGNYIQANDTVYALEDILMRNNKNIQMAGSDGGFNGVMKVSTGDVVQVGGVSGWGGTIGQLALYSNDAEAVRIDENQWVGIGTTSPQQQLTVGTLETSSIVTHGTVGIKTASDNKAINIQENSGAEGWGFGVDVSGNLNFYDSSSTDPSVQFIDNGGVKFNNAYTFPTADGSANQVLQTDGSGNLSFGTAAGGGVSISNNADNRVLTGDGTNANAEANLTFDGSTLNITGKMTVNEGNAFTDLNIKSDRTSGNIGGVNFVNASDVIKGQIFGTTAGNLHIFTGGQTQALLLDSSQLATFASHVRLGDSKQLQLGSSQDLQIYHNATDSFIVNETGNLYIRNRADNKDIFMQTDDGSGGVINYMIFDGSNERIIVEKNVTHSDNVRGRYGASNDLQIYHDATDSRIENSTGNLYINNKLDDGDIIFQSDDGSGGLATYFKLDGGNTYTSVSKNFLFQDNVRADFGNDSDLRIYHTGSHSYIDENGTGNLYIGSNNGGGVYINGSAETLASFVDDGAVTLYYDGSSRLTTTSTGIQVDGPNGNVTIGAQNTTGLHIYTDRDRFYFNKQTSHISNSITSYSGDFNLQRQESTKLTLTSTGVAVAGNLTATGSLSAASLNTGHGDNELYAMNQNVRTSDSPSFNTLTVDSTSSTHNLILSNYADFLDSSSHAAIWITSGATGVDVFKSGEGAHLVFEGRRNSRNFYFKVGDVDAPQHIMHNNGKVGIGTGDITPSSTLQVSGSIQGTSFSDGTISGITFIDEDSFSTNSATRVPTQQSIKAYVDAQVAGVVDSAPAALNTLNELAAALGDDASFSTTTSTALGNRLRVDTASQGLTGTQQAHAITNLGIRATKAELNLLDGVTATTTELNYTDGVTSNIQTQLNGKLSTSGTAPHANNLNATDDRDIAPEDLSYTDDLRIYFADKGGLETGTIGSNYQDVLVLNSYSDATGGDANALAFDKSEKKIYHYQADQAATNWGTAKTLAYTDDITLSTLSITATATELNYTDGVTSNIQTQLDGKQASGSYLTGNQTITLSGDVSGSGTTSIAVTIADDSHNHVISNVDGLQTALDAKLASSSYTASDVLTKIKTVDGASSGLDADLLDGQHGSYYRNAGNINAGTINTARLPNPIQLSGGNAIIKLQETDVTNSPNWWHVADGGNYSIRLNNTGTYPIKIETNGTNDAVSNIVLGYNTDFSAGIDVTGNITVTGTVDGRDVATDGSKLDGIESGATADQTQSDINALGITQVGTITSGTWNGTAIASAYLDSDTAHLSGTQTFSGAKSFTNTMTTRLITMDIPDNGSAPATTGIFMMKGYEGRGLGIKLRDSANSASGANNREWFVGTGYAQSGFNIGYASDGSQSSYSAQNKLAIDTSGNVTIPGGNLGVTGNITVTGTVDGRDIASDGSKLDGIEAGATADQTLGDLGITATAAELNVLDGYTGSVTELNYLDTLHATGVTSTEFDYLDGVTSNIQTQLNGKLGTADVAANSQQLDGIDSSQFLRSDTADSASGTLTFTGTQKYTGSTFWQVSSSDTALQRADARDDDTDKARLHWYGINASGGNTNFRHAWYDGSAYVNVDVASQVVSFSGGLSASGNITVTGTVDGRDVATDGTKLDGIEANATADQTQSEINALGITATGLSGTPNISVGTITTTGDIDLTGTSDTGNEKIILPRGGHIAFYGDGDLKHAISSMSTDDIRINSYGEVILNLDSNNNQTNAANFRIVKHGGTSSAGTAVFSVDGENGNVTVTGTVDGRDVATDGTKLDGISVGADVTPSWVPSSDPSYATQSYVGTQISNLVDSSPAALNTLNELAAAIGDDANFSTTVTNSIATKLPLAGGTMTGNLTIGSTTDSTKIVFPDKNVADNPTAAGDDRQLISMGNSGAGGLFQTTGRGGLMLASADDSVIIASGDVGRNYDPDAGSWNPDPDNEEIYLLTDGGVRFRTNLQTVASYKEFVFDNSGNATIPGNIAVTGTVDGRDVATDGSKLDGIESGATADQTQSDINALGIAQVGTISSGTWLGTAIASAYLDSDTAHLSGTQTFTGNKTFSGSTTLSGGVSLSNSNITNVNALSFADPGPNEGISWSGGNTKIYESPDDLTTNTAGNLQVVYGSTRRLTVTNTGVDVNGTLTATTKSFDIEHPSKEGMRLRYGSLEGPENGVYVRGKSKEKVISLPDYWVDLVHEDSITVQLTAIGGGQNLYVEEIKDNKVYVNGENYFYYIQAERKDVERFEVEYESDL